jgi:hypothetical protein
MSRYGYALFANRLTRFAQDVTELHQAGGAAPVRGAVRLWRRSVVT